MIHQYSPQRHRYERVGGRLLAVGTIPVGTIFSSAPVARWPYRERKLIVDAWLPREIGAARRIGAHYVNGYVARGGHLALCRCLATGRSQLLADHFIRFCIDQDLPLPLPARFARAGSGIGRSIQNRGTDMTTLTNWKARRAGGRITINATDKATGRPIKVVAVDSIDGRSGKPPIATDKDGRQFELA